MIQIRDRKTGGWEHPYESVDITEIVTKPFLILQYNWYKMQEYNQNDLLSLSQRIMGDHFSKISFQYVPKQEDARAALNFHLTKREKINIAEALENQNNQESFDQFYKFIQTPESRMTKGAVLAGKQQVKF
jgi:hypothetical protein